MKFQNSFFSLVKASVMQWGGGDQYIRIRVLHRLNSRLKLQNDIFDSKNPLRNVFLCLILKMVLWQKFFFHFSNVVVFGRKELCNSTWKVFAGAWCFFRKNVPKSAETFVKILKQRLRLINLTSGWRLLPWSMRSHVHVHGGANKEARVPRIPAGPGSPTSRRHRELVRGWSDLRRHPRTVVGRHAGALFVATQFTVLALQTLSEEPHQEVLAKFTDRGLGEGLDHEGVGHFNAIRHDGVDDGRPDVGRGSALLWGDRFDGQVAHATVETVPVLWNGGKKIISPAEFTTKPILKSKFSIFF